ncbi:MAG TPA: hypothetical protein VIF62_13035 [Labilithrix sp.]
MPPPITTPVPLGAPSVVPGSLEARALLADTPVKAQRYGAGPLAIVASGPMAEGERLGAFVEVPRDACLLAYGRASPSLEDIDLAAFADEGNPLAVDESPDPKPTLLICPPHPDRVYVAAHAASGEGLCVIAAQLVPKDKAPDVGRAVGARGALGGSPRTPEAWPGLDDQVRAHRASIGGQWEDQRRVALGVDARLIASVAFNVEDGGCTDALVVPDEDVALVDVDVVDADGRLVARAHDSGATRGVTVCSPVAMQGSLQVRPHIGRGLAAVVIGKAKPDQARDLLARPEVAWAAPSQPLETTRAARNAALAKAGYGPPTATLSGQVQLGRRTTVTVDLVGGGACTRIDVVAGAPLALVEASAWDDSGALLASSEGADGATLFACGHGRARIDLATRGRPGPYAVLVRPEKWRDPSFAAHPLAAGRMLGRAATVPAWLHEGTAGAVRALTLDAAHQSVQNTNIPAGKCLRVAVGVEGEGTGLELRLYDAVSGDELDRSHGQNAGAVRACAGAAARSVRLDVRATAGKLDAVLGERVVGP